MDADRSRLLRLVEALPQPCLTVLPVVDADGTLVDVSLDDLRSFRQWGSRTPGHPEWGHTAGIETTTGPLGQGISTAVGMAIADRFLAERYNRPLHEIVDRFKMAVVLAARAAREYGFASEKDQIVVTAGVPFNVTGTTNILRVAPCDERLIFRTDPE